LVKKSKGRDLRYKNLELGLTGAPPLVGQSPGLAASGMAPVEYSSSMDFNGQTEKGKKEKK